MRKLLYVPIIHSEPDLGSLGPNLARETASLLGPERWQQHRATVAQFWHSVAEYLLSLDASRLKIYQDGLAAGGKLGRRIVTAAAKMESPNYQLILELMNQGAEVRKTEEASLLLKEKEIMEKAAHNEVEMGQLLEERDRFIAETINQTLREGEVAVLFIGANHQVLSYLTSDIEVKKLKEPEMVRAYFQELLGNKDARKFEQLAHYLAAPISRY